MNADPVIHLKNVSFSFSAHKTVSSSEKAVVSIADWALYSREKVFIHGASGTGKTTFLNLLMGIWAADNGQITSLGQRLDRMNSRQRDRFRAHYMGCIFQQFNLIPYLNALENMALAKQFAHKTAPKTHRGSDMHAEHSADQLLSRLNLAQEEWRRPVGALSVGQQQRVAIARALVHRPPLLFADEATSSLDDDNTQAFMALLMSLADEYEASVVFVSHDRSLASYFDRTDDFSQLNTQEVAA